MKRPAAQFLKSGAKTIFQSSNPAESLLRNSYRSISCTPTRSGQRTCLYDFHKSLGGKMIDFGGWEMPVQYSDLSIADSTVHTRKHVSLFDVSHMLQSRIHGKDRVAFMESLVPADVEGLREDFGTLSIFTNPNGGIEDDLIVSKTSLNHLYLVTNAGCIEKDLPYMMDAAERWRSVEGDVAVEPLHGRGLIAVQGPEMQKVLSAGLLGVDLSRLYFMHSVVTSVFGIPDCRITRCGYTGEDGVEISVPEERTAELVEQLLNSKEGSVKMAGLGARDALRLEAGLCLYGNDIDEKTTPSEAGLLWVVAKRRRETGGFPGDSVILQQIKDKSAAIKRVGLLSEKGRPPRRGAVIVSESGEEIGKVTSGCPSPCLKKNIAMGYVKKEASKNGTKVQIDSSGKRDKMVEGEIVKMPFVPSNYYQPPKN